MGDESFRPPESLAQRPIPGLRGHRAGVPGALGSGSLTAPGSCLDEAPARAGDAGRKTVLKVRAAVSALLAAVVAVSIVGCSFTNGDIILPRKYDPSDGVSAEVGDLSVRNAM